MVAAVALGIAASSSLNSDGTPGSTSSALREASTIIFLVLTLLLVFQTVYLSRFRLRGTYNPTHFSFFFLKNIFQIRFKIGFERARQLW